MTVDDALVRPFVGAKPDALGNRCIMIANAPDVDALHRLFNPSGGCTTRKLFMSRLHYGYDNPAISLAGPFIGAPYAVILLESLITWGISEVILLGWCGSLSPEIGIGDIVIPDRAFIDDGTSKNYLKDHLLSDQVFPSAAIQASLKSTFAKHQVDFHEGPVWSTDAIFRETREKIRFFQKLNAFAVDMEAAALFAAGHFRGIEVGCVLMVSDELASLKWKPGFHEPDFRRCRGRVGAVLQQFWR